MPRSRWYLYVATLALSGSVLAACGGDGSGSGASGVAAGRFATVGEDSLAADAPIPAPSGAVTLTLTGALSRPNVGSTVQFDMATLERLGLREGVVYEPWEKVDTRFTGVDLLRLLESVGVSTNAVSIHIIALDDYQIDLPMAEIRSGSIMLATRQDGVAIPVDKGGPTRIVFGDGTTSGENPDQWIWNIATIEIRE